MGFVDEGGTPDGTLNFYERLNNPTHIAKNVIFITTLTNDGGPGQPWSSEKSLKGSVSIA